MKKIIYALLVSAALISAPAKADDSLYQAFGAQAGMSALMDEFFKNLQADKRMQPFLKKPIPRNSKPGWAIKCVNSLAAPVNTKGRI